MLGQTRRRFLQGLAVASAGSVTGCTDISAIDAGGDDDRTAQASFFVVSDFAAQLVGDTPAVENLVPFGQHGHGWEPGPNIQRDVLDSEAFIYVGEGFQPWADKVVQNVHDDGADVAVIEAWDGVDLIETTDEEDGHEEEHGDGEEHDEEHGDGEEHDEEHGEGEEHTEEHHDDQDQDDHDHGAVDPHFWLDPVRAAESVHAIARQLSEVFPDEASTFESNADAYAARLDELHHSFEDRLAARTHSTVLFAGHNSFRYLGRRYDIQVGSLTGLSPDDTPTTRDVSRAQDVIEEHDIEYVLAPVFESDRAATELVEQTTAVDVLPLTAVPTLASEWAADGWGYVDVMEQINLSSLERALGIE